MKKALALALALSMLTSMAMAEQKTTEATAYGYGGETNPNAEVVFNQYGLYAQDEWNILENLKYIMMKN